MQATKKQDIEKMITVDIEGLATMSDKIATQDRIHSYRQRLVAL